MKFTLFSKKMTVAAAAGLLALLAHGQASAQTWNVGSGNWNVATNWNPNVVPNSAEATVVLGGIAGAQTINILADEAFQTGSFDSGFGRTVSLASGSTLTTNGNTLLRFGSSVTGAGSLVVNGTATWNNFTMTGTGSTTFNNSLTMADLPGPSQVTGRTINTNGATSLNENNNIFRMSNATWNNSGTLTRNRTGAANINANIELQGTSVFNNLAGGTFVKAGGTDFAITGGVFNNAGTVRSNEALFTVSSGFNNSAGGLVETNGGAINLSGTTANAGELRASNGVLTVSGALTNNATGLINAVGSNVVVSGAFVNNGGEVRASGGNTVTINNYTHNAGTISLDGGTLAGTGALAVNGGQVQGNGTIARNVTIGAASTLSPGNSVGVLNIVGNLAVNGTYKWDVESATSADLVTVTGNLDLTGSTLDVTFLGNGPSPASVYTLFAYNGSLTGTFANLVGPLSGQWVIDYAATNPGVNGGAGFGNFVTITSVPEPSSMALLGLTSLGLVFRRRRA
jgi:hypothetical protein